MEFTPRDFLRRYPQLSESVNELSNLAELNPKMFREILELGMVMAIHAEEKRSEKIKLIPELESFPSPPSTFAIDWGKESI